VQCIYLQRGLTKWVRYQPTYKNPQNCFVFNNPKLGVPHFETYVPCPILSELGQCHFDSKEYVLNVLKRYIDHDESHSVLQPAEHHTLLNLGYPGCEARTQHLHLLHVQWVAPRDHHGWPHYLGIRDALSTTSIWAASWSSLILCDHDFWGTAQKRWMRNIKFGKFGGYSVALNHPIMTAMSPFI
jgi:hypothetical protein